MKLKPEDLDIISQKSRLLTDLRIGSARVKITIHMGTCGIASGAENILRTFQSVLEKAKVDDILITTSGCAGLCSREPMTTVELKGESPVKYIDLDKEKVEKIFEKHILKGEIVEEYALGVGCERVL